MKKSIFAFLILTALIFSMTGCGKGRPEEKPASVVESITEPVAASAAKPAAEPAAPASASEPAGQSEAPAAAEPAAVPARQDGERFEATIVIEGMEETVKYEHIRNDAIGFEMDYDYERFERRSEPGRECFVSVYDDSANPENYLEVKASAEDAETVAAAIGEMLSNDYEISSRPFTLDRAGSCIRIDASEEKGGGVMPEQLQMVYVIPAPDGCRIATEHYAIVGSEGFGRRFSYFMNTFSVTAGQGERELSDEKSRSDEKSLTDEEALAAVRNYCFASNPDLKGIADSGEYPVYWDIASSDEQQVVVVFRSYTGALIRYYIDRASGDAYVTEFVPGITPDEARTDESLNVRDYLD